MLRMWAITVQSSTSLVIGFDGVPRRLFDVRVFEHFVFGLRVFHPFLSGVDVHLAQLPAPSWVAGALVEAALLLLVTDREPILQQDDARADEHALKFWTRAEELGVFRRSAETHDILDTRSVVP